MERVINISPKQFKHIRSTDNLVLFATNEIYLKQIISVAVDYVTLIFQL